MAKFKVGDRARLVASKLYPERIGEELTIVEVDCGRPSGLEYRVSFDSIPNPSSSTGWLAEESQLEPIVDLGSWDELQKTINWNPTKEASHVE